MSFRGVVTTHYNDVIMSLIASQITSLTIVYSTVYSDANQRKHQSSASLVFVRGIHRGHMNSPHKGPVTRKIFPFDDVIMWWYVRGNRSAVQFSLEINWRVYNTQDKMSHILNGRKKNLFNEVFSQLPPWEHNIRLYSTYNKSGVRTSQRQWVPHGHMAYHVGKDIRYHNRIQKSNDRTWDIRTFYGIIRNWMCTSIRPFYVDVIISMPA